MHWFALTNDEKVHHADSSQARRQDRQRYEVVETFLICFKSPYFRRQGLRVIYCRPGDIAVLRDSATFRHEPLSL